MKSKLSRQQEESQREASLDIESILRERYQKNEEPVSRVGEELVRRSAAGSLRAATAGNKKSTAPMTLTPVQTKTARMAGNGATGRKRNVIRVSVDFPVGLYEAVVEESNEREQTIREFILGLVRQHFAN